MDSVFRSAREKLEREHRESKESGKVELERQKKADDAAKRQREAVEASQRARRLESLMKVGDEKEDVKHRGVDSQMMVMQGNEHRGEMSREAKVDGVSDKDKDKLLVAYYKALLKQQNVAEHGAPVSGVGNCRLFVGEEEEDEEVCWEED